MEPAYRKCNGGSKTTSLGRSLRLLFEGNTSKKVIIVASVNVSDVKSLNLQTEGLSLSSWVSL